MVVLFLSVPPESHVSFRKKTLPPVDNAARNPDLDPPDVECGSLMRGNGVDLNGSMVKVRFFKAKS